MGHTPCDSIESDVQCAILQTSFGVWIRETREQRGESRRVFAEAIGCSLATLKRWESGTAEPNRFQRERIGQALEGGFSGEDRPDSDQYHSGWWIRTARQLSRLSIREAATQAGIASSSWNRYELGQTPLSTSSAEELALAVCPTFSTPRIASDSLQNDLLAMAPVCGFNPATSIGAALSSARLAAVQGDRVSFGLAHLCIANCLMQIGDLDFSGRAFVTASRLIPKEMISTSDFLGLRASRVWRGFPHIQNPREAIGLANWLAAFRERSPRSIQSQITPAVAMLWCWAELPQKALDLLNKEPEVGPFHTHMRLWIEAKFGNPGLALESIQQGIDGAPAHHAFVGNKIALESALNLKQYGLAVQHLSAMEAISKEFGMWAPGLIATSRRLRNHFQLTPHVVQVNN